jgi:MoaD family protein
MPAKSQQCTEEAMVTVRFFSILAKLFNHGELTIDATRATDVRQALDQVCDTTERMRGVFAAPEIVRRDVTILVNGRNIAFLAGLGTPLKSGDVVSLVPPLAGG